jgi:hypothetical protein
MECSSSEVGCRTAPGAGPPLPSTAPKPSPTVVDDLRETPNTGIDARMGDGCLLYAAEAKDDTHRCDRAAAAMEAPTQGDAETPWVLSGCGRPE